MLACRYVAYCLCVVHLTFEGIGCFFVKVLLIIQLLLAWFMMIIEDEIMKYIYISIYVCMFLGNMKEIFDSLVYASSWILLA